MRRLRLQLIGILVLAIVLPLLPASYAARELFKRSLDPLLASGLFEGAEAGLAVTRDVIDGHKARWLADLRAGYSPDTLGAPARARLQLDERAVPQGGEPETLGDLLLLSAPEVRTTDSTALLVAQVRARTGAPVWIARALPETLATRAARLSRGMQLLQSLRLERRALLRGLEATFLFVYLAMAALVLGLGLLLTSRLTRPLSELAGGIDRVAAGDLATRVSEQGSGEIAELMRHFNGMTERLHTQQAELGRLERLSAWRQMARFLAHEIKNPLTPIQLAAEQMRDAYRGEDEKYRELLRESAGIIQEEVLGMRNLVGEFSQFGRLPEPSPALVEAMDLGRELAQLYGAAQLEVHAGPLPASTYGPLLWCDREQIKRALVNLIDNALAAQRSSGCEVPVVLALLPHPESGGSRLLVRDRGPGIPDERKRRVFEPDYTTKSDGMGLGLAIVEHIVLQHRGTIAVHDAPGGGAEFEILLPPRLPARGPDA